MLELGPFHTVTSAAVTSTPNLRRTAAIAIDAPTLPQSPLLLLFATGIQRLGRADRRGLRGLP